jgi:hypothetical protein
MGVDEEVRMASIEQIPAQLHQREPEPSLPDEMRADADLAEIYGSLMREWRDSLRPSSTLRYMIEHTAHQRIIGLGLAAPVQVTSLLLTDLKERPYHLFAALQAITGADPAAESRTFSEARSAWLAWGRQRSPA